MKSAYPMMAVALGLALSVSVATPVVAGQYGGNSNDKNMASDSKEMTKSTLPGSTPDIYSPGVKYQHPSVNS